MNAVNGRATLLIAAAVLLAGAELAGAGGRPKYGTGSAWGRDSYAQYAGIPGAEAVGADQCATCHGEVSQGFRLVAHGQAGVGCEDCHGPGSLHVPDTTHAHIHSFTKETVEAANGNCLHCHAEEAALRDWSLGRHRREGVRCTDCHDPHAAPSEGNRTLSTSRTCFRCHQEQKAQGDLPFHHPVREGRMGCTDCHDPHGALAGAVRASHVNDLCFQCHAEYRGPFTYQHPPVVESCLKCHEPHGSMNAHLLQVSQPMLCLQCHAGHHDGSTISLLNACTNCHGSIHGTDTPSATGGSVFIDK